MAPKPDWYLEQTPRLRTLQAPPRERVTADVDAAVLTARAVRDAPTLAQALARAGENARVASALISPTVAKRLSENAATAQRLSRLISEMTPKIDPRVTDALLRAFRGERP